MVKLWTRASDMAGAPSVFGGSVLVGRAETEVGRGIRAIADQVLRLHVREQTGLMPQTHRKHQRWPGDGQSPKCRSGTRHNPKPNRAPRGAGWSTELHFRIRSGDLNRH